MPIQVDVLIATYNGEKYLHKQLKSILNQTHSHLHLIIRDDQSTDKTVEIIDAIQSEYPQRVTRLPSTENLGIVANFSALMQASKADYIVFSDQDDIWLPEKISQSLLEMRHLEKLKGKETPLLVHTDLQVVDEQLNVINPSFWHHIHLHPYLNTLNRLVNQNVVTGCTMMINRPLLLLSAPIPQEAVMHDWWIALVASAFGQISLVNESTILYRQHSNNDTGATKYGINSYLKKMFNLTKRKKIQKRSFLYQKQIRTFLERYDFYLTPEQIKMLKDFDRSRDCFWLKKLILILRHGFFKHGFLRNLGEFLPSFF